MAKEKDAEKAVKAAEKALKKIKKDEKLGKVTKSAKKDKKASKSESKGIEKSFSLLADDKSVDSKLSSLFAAPPPQPTPKPATEPQAVSQKRSKSHAEPEATSIEQAAESEATSTVPEHEAVIEEQPHPKRKRKRNDADDDLEARYLNKLESEVEREHAAKRGKKEGAQSGKVQPAPVLDQPANASADSGPDVDAQVNGDADEIVDSSEAGEDEEAYVPPKHETETAGDNELEKAGRTVFLGNVSVTAITSKSARKTLEKHLASFKTSKDGEEDKKKVLESIRFRSTPYSPTLPKKAAFAMKEVHTATTQSTNAYAVYTTPALAREAVRKLNGTVVLDRYLRVDSVAHPAQIDHRRCVFVGNLGFVDDESNIVAANEAEGRETRKTNQKPSDVEEGLWRLFSKHGTVESVRVVRDKGTRVGIGIAYVQFTDEIAVEAALAENDKKAPPMLPRRLRVTRAKAIKRNKIVKMAKPEGKQKGEVQYRRKVTPGEATQKGRIGKLMGKAAAAMAGKPGGFKPPESFVFEGHRAKQSQGKAGLKLGKKKKAAKPVNHSTKRAAAFRKGGGKPKS